jgi:uncharacterized radical SAM protein YgiQ
MTKKEMNNLGWEELDVILVTGDAYVDHPSFGVALIARVLEDSGLRVGVISQPDWRTADDITRLGKPKLFFGITAGNVDSMVANYTASRRKRRTDDYTPGGYAGKRPDRATIVYSNLVKKYFKDVPVIIGGIEASLRRFAHYDWWSDSVRRSILLDSKADLLVYGMAERTIVQIAEILRKGGSIQDCYGLRGVVYWTSKIPEDALILPSFEEVKLDKRKYAEAFKKFYLENDPITGEKLTQLHGTQWVVQNPPQYPLTQKELDHIYGLNYTRKVHPECLKKGHVKAIETVKFSITSHRGCYGGCAFCAITLHQGKIVTWRSKESVIEEAKKITKMDDFKGIISDVGGPTANMYGYECDKKLKHGTCRDKLCLFPEVCPSLRVNHSKYIELLEELRKIPKVRKVFVSSGIRHDLVLEDKKYGEFFLIKLSEHHISGQLKLAPEHSDSRVLKLMRKPDISKFRRFKSEFQKINKRLRKKQYIIVYLIAAHPGSGEREAKNLKNFVKAELKYRPQQVQIFTPTPSTISTTMYYTGLDPFTNEKVFVEKSERKRRWQKDILLSEKNISDSKFKKL